MTRLHFRTLSLQLQLRLKTQSLQDRAAASPELVGQLAAQSVHEYAQQHQLGYYPALDYFRDEDTGFDKDLLDAIDNLAWLSAQLARNESMTQLRPVFSNVEVASVQSVCYLMPKVRPQTTDALEALATHFTPNQVKLGLKVTLLQKRANPEGLEAFTRKMAWKWLQDSFANVEVSQAKLSKL